MSSLLLFISVIVISGTHELQLPSGGGWQQRIEIVPDSTQFDIHLPWLVQGSLSVLSNDDSLQSGVDFTWSDSTQTVTFFPVHLISPGDTLLIRYRSAAVIDRLEFQYYTPSVITDMDSSASISDSGIVRRKTERFDPLGAWGGLHRRGTLTRGVRFGETNDNVVSGLHLELSGRPVPGVTVDAVLDDRDIPAAGGGGSATLSELDRILFKVSTPHLIAELGDWDLNWEQGRYGRLNRQLKGGRLQANYSPIQAEIAAAGDDNTYHSIMLSGRTGDQGPYELTDRFGRPGVVVATGSERIYLNGIQLKRGREADYTIDYQRGAITFTPNVVIRSDSRIEAEYEYNDGNYPRYLYAGRLTKIYRGMTNHTRSGVINTAATNLAIDASAVIEGSNGDSPLAFEWNDIWQNAISSAGDDLLGAVVSGVDSVDSGNGDYVWSYIDGERVLEFSQPDSLGGPTGYLQVNFSTDPTGDYKRFYDFSFQTFYYQWIGSGLGDWSPVQHLPLPDQLKHVDLITRFNIGRFDIEGEAAVSDYDRNTFSSLDDDDNVGMAWNGRLLWGRQDYDVLFASFSVRNRECHYTSLERNVEPDYRYKWNLSDSVQGAETAIETDVHFNPISQVVFSGNAGWLEQGNDNTSQRLGLRSLWKGKRLQAEAGFDQAKNDSRSRSNDSKRTHWDGRIKRSIGAFRPVYSFQAEWERDRADTSSINGSRFILHEISLEKYFSYTRESRNPRVGIMKADGLDSRFRGNDKVGLTFNYRSEDKLGSERDIHWSDTRSLQANWQSRRPRTGGWSMDFQRTYTTYTDRAHSSITATSAALEALYNPYTSPWSIQADYRLSTGNDRIGATVASYVGERRGTHRREGDRYVPDPDGDFSLRDVMTDTLDRVSRIEFNGRIRWQGGKGHADKQNWKPPLGLTGSATRLAANITTSANDPWQSFLLDPDAFHSDDALQSRFNIVQDFDFLEGNPAGDGRISLRWDKRRDRALSGGESNRNESISLRIRRKLTVVLRSRVEPKIERCLRRGLISGEIRSEVSTIGCGSELTFKPHGSSIEAGLGFDYVERDDRRKDQSVVERVWEPRLVWTIGRSGTARIEGQWRRLSSNVTAPGYDLDRGWLVGDNFLVRVNVDYRMHKNLTLTVYYRGRWREQRSPSHDGLLEVTAVL